MARERRSFKMDQQLLVDIIKRQAGSLWKAISEAVMNAVDAGASKCDIELSRQMLVIRDNGKGFRSRKDIEQFFEIFGKPHDAREEKKFGRFRMGRGQLFAFGANTWRSNVFEMTVDVERDGLDYHLDVNKEHLDGCTITVELYKQLTNTDFARIQTEIRDNGKYLTIPATLNGAVFPQNKSRVKWDMELEEADIRFKQNQDLRVYNQGVLVKSFYRSKYGVGGDVVTKVPLQVNFARNDIMDSCPVWRKLAHVLQQHANDQQTSTRPSSDPQHVSRRRGARTPVVRLTEEDRIRLANQAKDGELDRNAFKNARIWRRVSCAANVTVRTIYNQCAGKVTMAPAADYHWQRRADIHQVESNHMACVLHRDMLDRFGFDRPERIVTLSNLTIGVHDKYRLSYLSWDGLLDTLKSTSQVIPDDNLTRLELVVISVLRESAPLLFRGYSEAARPNAVLAEDRQLMVGRSPLRSWTDGISMTGLQRELIKENGIGLNAWVRYAHIIMHEALHHIRTDRRHSHGKTFYAKYHEWSSDPNGLGWYLARCLEITPRIAEAVGQKLSEQELRALDRLEERQQFAEEQTVLAGTTSATSV